MLGAHRLAIQESIFQFEGGEIRYVVAYSEDRFHLRLIGEHLFAERHVGVLETIVRFPCLFKPRQPVGKLSIERITVGRLVGKDVGVIHVVEFGDEFRSALGPSNIDGGDPFTILGPSRQCDLVAINRSTHFQTIDFRWPGKHLSHPGAIVIVVSGISRTADQSAAAVADPDVVLQAKAAGRDMPFRQSTDEMERIVKFHQS